jgi:hypothetical protein
MHRATIYFAEPSLAKLDGPVSEIRGSGIARITDESSKTIVGGHKMHISTTNIPTFHSRYIR